MIMPDEVKSTLEKIEILQKRINERLDARINIFSFLCDAYLEGYKDEFKTPEICLRMITRFCRMIDYQHNREHIFYFNPHCNWDNFFNFIPKKFLSQDFFDKLLDAASNEFQYLPKTMDLCLMSVTNDASTLKYVPNEYKTAELCAAAVERWDRALKYVPKHLKTIEFCAAIVRRSIRALGFVPPEIVEQVLEKAREEE